MPTATSSSKQPVIEELGPVQDTQTAPGAPQEIGPVEELGPVQENPILHGLKNYWNQVNPVTGAQGMLQQIRHPIDTINSRVSSVGDAFSNAGEDFKGGHVAQGIARILAAGSPLEQARGQIEKGDYSGATGTTLGVATNLVGPKLLEKAPRIGIPEGAADTMQSGAKKIYKSALKPSTGTTPRKLDKMLTGALEEGVPVDAKGGEKISNTIRSSEDLVDRIIGAEPDKPVSLAKPTANLDKLSAEYSEHPFKKGVSEVEGIKQKFQESNPEPTIPAVEAQKMKRATYRGINETSWDQRKTPAVQAEKGIGVGLKDAVEEQFPEVAEPNARASRMYSLQKPHSAAVSREANKTPMGLGRGMAAGAGLLTGALSHNPAVGLATGAVGLLLDDAGFRSKIAIAIHKASKGSIPLPAAQAGIQGVINSLGAKGSNGDQEN